MLSPAPSGPIRPQLPLREWACVHAELVWIYESLVEPRFRDFQARGRPGHWAWYIRAGQARVTPAHGGAVLEARPGEWIFPPEDGFRQEFSGDARILSVHFACQWPSGEDMLASGEGLVVPGERYPQLLRRAEQLEHLVSRHFQPDTRHYSHFSEYEQFLDFQVVFLRWLSLWMRLRREYGARPNRLSVGDDRVLRAISSLNNAPLQDGFPQATLEAATGLGETHLGRLFFAEHGMTPRKYWEQRRLRVARASLETSNLPIKELAYSLGFRSDAHFVVWFRDRVGQRPKEYRTHHRENFA